MRVRVGIFVGILVISLMLVACSIMENDKASQQRVESVETRAQMFERSEAKYPVPYTENFPLRGLLVDYTERQDLLNHPWYTYIFSDTGAITHYFVSTTLPVSTSAFLSSTEDWVGNNYGNLIMTAPSLDGMFYGGAGGTTGNNGWIFKDASTGTMCVVYGMKILTLDAPLILETEPILIQAQS